MTKSQINTIISKYGGWETLLKTKMFMFVLDGIGELLPDKSLDEEKLLDSFQNDSANELFIVKVYGKLWSELNDFTPTVTTMYIPYDIVFSIQVMEDKMLV